MEKTIFSRRVHDLEELATALRDLAKQVDCPASEIPFNGQVRLDLLDSQLLFTILKRN
jgi:hypothetical protein